LLVAALPEKNLSQVMDNIKNIPAINPFEVGPQDQALGGPRALQPEEDGRSFPAGAPRRPQAVPAPGLYAVSVPFRNGDPAGFPVSFPVAPSPDAEDTAWRAGVGRHLRPGGVSGQAMGVSQTPAPRGDGGSRASTRRQWQTAGSRGPAQEEAVEKEDRWRPGIQRQQRFSLPCRTGPGGIWPLLQALLLRS
jgi:hypothetical protein